MPHGCVQGHKARKPKKKVNFIELETSTGVRMRRVVRAVVDDFEALSAARSKTWTRISSKSRTLSEFCGIGCFVVVSRHPVCTVCMYSCVYVLRNFRVLVRLLVAATITGLPGPRVTSMWTSFRSAARTRITR